MLWRHHEVATLIGAQRLHLPVELGNARLERVDLVGQLDDPFDASKVDTLIVGESLHLAQQVDIVFGIPPSATGTAPRTDQTQPVVGTQRLGVHAG